MLRRTDSPTGSAVSRVLILGGTGMLGHVLWRECRARFNVSTTTRRTELDGAAAEALDPEQTVTSVRAEEPESIERAIEAARPDVIVNCIGVVKQLVDNAGPIATIRTNSLFPHELAAICERRHIRLIHVSTDCVFSGRRGGYSEHDRPDPEDLYGRSKLVGEPTDSGVLTLRTSMIGWELASRHGLVEWFLAQCGGAVHGLTRSTFTGPTSPVVARAIADVVEHHDGLDGTWHLGAEPISKHDLLVLLREALGVEVEIVPDDGIVVDRSLDSSRFREATGWVAPSWREMVAELGTTAARYEGRRGSVARR